MANIGKQDVVEKIATKLGCSKREAEGFVNAFIELIEKEVTAGNAVRITGFGSFKSVKRAARKGVNPATGAAINIPACNAVSFKVGKSFKEMVK